MNQNEVRGSTRRFGIIGYPLQHSVSPVMHNAAFLSQNLDALYFPLALPPQSLADVVPALPFVFSGFNVTVPHKEEILPWLQGMDEHATRIGAVNTVHEKDKKLYGSNTDWLGFRDSLQRDYNLPLQGQSILLFGAGGSTRACLYALLMAKVARIRIINRTLERAKSLLDLCQPGDPPVDVLSSEDTGAIREAMSEADLIVNTTSVGLQEGDVHPADFSTVRPKTFVYDLIYGSRPTDFLARASAQGLATGNGKGMLVRQGAQSFEIWTGLKPSLAVMAKAAQFSIEGDKIL